MCVHKHRQATQTLHEIQYTSSYSHDTQLHLRNQYVLNTSMIDRQLSMPHKHYMKYNTHIFTHTIYKRWMNINQCARTCLMHAQYTGTYWSCLEISLLREERRKGEKTAAAVLKHRVSDCSCHTT